MKKDMAIVRELAAQVAEIAALPVQAEKRALWRALNARKPMRPMVLMDQLPWHELTDASLTLQCEDQRCREHEQALRRLLYRWKHFRVDMVMDSFVEVPRAVTGWQVGPPIAEDLAVMDPGNDVVGHRYLNQFVTEDDLEKIQPPSVAIDVVEDAARFSLAHELYDGLLEIRPTGPSFHLCHWDKIAMWMGVENALYALIDTPDYMHAILSRLTDTWLCLIDQLEEQGLFGQPQSLVHCTGAYTDELPAPGFDPQRSRAKDHWIAGMAQMLSTVSPETFAEFELAYCVKLFARFGLAYYGCCEPLDDRMQYVRQIPNLRKVSMSPWVKQDRGAEAIGRDFVFSRKPSPAFLAVSSFDAEAVRTDLTATRVHCDKFGCPLEFILKDISTVCYEPGRLNEWARVAMEVAER